jgi:hypothetical protein
MISSVFDISNRDEDELWTPWIQWNESKRSTDPTNRVGDTEPHNNTLCFLSGVSPSSAYLHISLNPIPTFRIAQNYWSMEPVFKADTKFNHSWGAKRGGWGRGCGGGGVPGIFSVCVTEGRERKRTCSWNHSILSKVALHMQDQDVSKSRRRQPEIYPLWRFENLWKRLLFSLRTNARTIGLNIAQMRPILQWYVTKAGQHETRVESRLNNYNFWRISAYTDH